MNCGNELKRLNEEFNIADSDNNKLIDKDEFDSWLESQIWK